MSGLLCWIFSTKSRSVEIQPNPCKEFFALRDSHAGNFWEVLGQKFPACQCEVASVSDFSPGPVGDDETLVSVVTSKAFISDQGTVEPTLFDSRISNGVSVDRKRHTTLAEYDSRAHSLVADNPKKENLGSIELSVDQIRKINHKGSRAIAVYDTGLKENRSHAEIACTEIPEAETPGRKKIRAKLRKSILDACLHNQCVLRSEEIFEDL